ncbi:MAG: flagellar biosynthesis protein FliQ [Limnochordales bacterium]|nr:flagellar biosynthesis protein FliQ [Limnochordales bacterium]
MSDATVISLMGQALRAATLVAAPLILIGLLVGLVVSLLQAVTQIQEQSLTFVPKLAAMILVLLLLGPWMLQVLVDLSVRLWGDLPSYIGYMLVGV